MSNNRENNNWDFEDEEDDEIQIPSYSSSESDLIKQFRRQLKAEKKARLEAETKSAELFKSQKERIIKDVLTSKGVSDKIAKFIPQDIEVSEDAIVQWLDSNADVFGFAKPEQEESPVNSQDIAAMQRMNKALTGADAATSSDTLESAIQNATSEEEILSILSGQ
jgi:Zn-dependent M16 (insulinase) family peptidase